MMFGGDVAAITEHARSLTRAERRCGAARTGDDAGDDIVVCRARDADRYRVPFIEYEAGDPRAETVLAARDRWIARPAPCKSHGPYLVGCGAVGVSAKVKFGAGGTGKPQVRGFAP
ncbi:MAG: hypothetical protein ACKVOB_11320 [Sphingomonas sp.]